jgi:hypothetical protein
VTRPRQRHGVPELPLCLPESMTGRMWGCWRRAVVRLSIRNRSGSTVAASSGVHDLERYWPIMSEVAGKVDRGHAAAPELALEHLAVG